MQKAIITGLMLLLGSLLIVQAQDSNARVINMWEMLNVRATPSSDAAVVGELAGRTSLIVIARSQDNRWFQVQTLEGLSGWVGSGFVELLSIELAQIPIVGVDAVAPPVAPEASAPQESVSAPSPDATNGRVTAGTLNLRTAPSTSGSIVARLAMNTRVVLIGRNAEMSWLQLQTLEGLTGWVSAAYIAPDIATSALPVVDGTVAEAPVSDSETVAVANTPAGDAPFFILGANSWNIYAKGQELGNRRTVFSKVGDSITVADVMYRPFGYGAYNLGDYAYLKPTIDFFSGTQARDNNSFLNTSLAAQNGWTTNTVLDPQYANQAVCIEGESPLACEYRTTKPAVAMIMFGSNDVTIVPSEQFAHNLRVIVEYSIANGVVPVLSTIPPRRGFEPEVVFYNQLIVETASQYGVSLWDYGAAMRTIPNDGLSPDGLHPSAPEGFGYAADFTGNYLQYGYVMRNLTALQALDVLRRRVLG